MASRVAVITGASQGIGRATALRLARDFSSLVLVARNRPNLEKTAALVRDAGAEALVIDADVSQVPAAKAVKHHRCHAPLIGAAECCEFVRHTAPGPASLLSLGCATAEKGLIARIICDALP